MQKIKKYHRLFILSRTFFSFLLVFVVMAFLDSCSKDPIRQVTGPEIPPPDDTITFDKGFFIVNEGNYTWGNASVTFIDEASGVIEQDLYQRINNKPLGDVAQSMEIINGKGYIVFYMKI